VSEQANAEPAAAAAEPQSQEEESGDKASTEEQSIAPKNRFLDVEQEQELGSQTQTHTDSEAKNSETATQTQLQEQTAATSEKAESEAAEQSTDSDSAAPTGTTSSGPGSVFSKPITDIPKLSLKLTTVLMLDFDTVASSSKDKDTFVSQFQADIAKALGIDSSRVLVMAVRAGSVIVDFALQPSSTDSRSVSDLAIQYMEMAEDPASPLHKGIVTAHVDPSAAVTVVPGAGAKWSSAARAAPVLATLLASIAFALIRI